MLIEREIEIARPREEVYEFVANPRNDPLWCRKVRAVEGSGDEFRVVHKPVPLRPPRTLRMRRMGADPPARIRWHQDDGTDVFEVTYELENTPGGTHFRQRSEATVGAVPRFLHPLWRHGISRDVARQLRDLKRTLEA